jgi:hypothetical protein
VNVESRSPPAIAEPEAWRGKLGKQPHLSNASLTHQSKSANSYQSDNSTNPLYTLHTFSKMAVKPITGMLRRGLVLDLSVAFGMPLRARVRPSPPHGG